MSETLAPQKHQGRTPRPGYRSDIDGLRAIAVLAVLFYHFRLPGFDGGFLGVDIFFVISGYLITQILLAQLERGRLDLLWFYERRIRRIVPALAVMIAAVVAASSMLLMPRNFAQLGDSLVAVVAALANFHFWQITADYFGPAAERIPLLHTWSLAVEEQFYLVFPLLLSFLLRIGRRWVWVALGIALVASLGLAEWMAHAHPTPAFYFPVTRAWQLLLGTLLAVAVANGTRLSGIAASGAGLVGMAMIAFSLLGLDRLSGIPGLAALVPCGGAALIILSGHEVPRTLSARALAARPLVWIGLISYSLYLWHWPIYSLMRTYAGPEPIGAAGIAAGVIGSFALAALSWRFVEQPIRSGAFLPTRRRLFLISAAAAVLIAGTGLAIRATGGVPSRFPGFAAYQLIHRSPPASALPCPLDRMAADPACVGRQASSGRRVLLWGDSFARHYGVALGKWRDRLPFSLALESRGGCLPLISFDVNFRPDCRRWSEGLIARAKAAQVDTIIISGRWSGQGDRLRLDLLEAMLLDLRSRGFRVILFDTSPTFPFEHMDEFHYQIVRRGGDPRRGTAHSTVSTEHRRRMRMTAQRAGAAYFDPGTSLCRGSECLYRDSGHYLIGATSHLTDEGAMRVLEAFLTSPDLGLESGYWARLGER